MPTSFPIVVPHCIQSQGMATSSKLRGKRKLKKNRNWSNYQLKAALKAVDKGAKICSTVDYYGIPRTTSRGHVHGQTQSRKRGSNTVFTTAEEEELVQYLLEMAKQGFPLTWLKLYIRISHMTQHQATPFKEGIPRNGWV